MARDVVAKRDWRNRGLALAGGALLFLVQWVAGDYINEKTRGDTEGIAYAIITCVVVIGLVVSILRFTRPLPLLRPPSTAEPAPRPVLPNEPADTTESRVPSLHIITAAYGPTGQETDVTGRVQRMVNNGRLDIQVSNHNLWNGEDYAFGYPKYLQVKYSMDGVEHTETWPESAHVRLP